MELAVVSHNPARRASSFCRPLWSGPVVKRTVYLGCSVMEKEGSSIAKHVTVGHVRRGGHDGASGVE